MKIKLIIAILAMTFLSACGGGESHKFTGKLETKVRNASDYNEITSGEDEAEISIVKKSEKQATLVVKKLKPDNNKLFLENCNLEMTAESDGNWKIVPLTNCKSGESDMSITGTVSVKDKKVLLQLAGDYTTLKYTWRLEGTETK